MLDLRVCGLHVARYIVPCRVAQAARQHQGPFLAAMGVNRHARAGNRADQARPGAVRLDQRVIRDARRDEPPGNLVEIGADIALQRRGHGAFQIRPAHDVGRLAVQPRQHGLIRILLQRNRRNIGEQRAARGFRLAHDRAAHRARRQMRGDQQRHGLVGRARSVGEQKLVAGMMRDRHLRSPNASRSRAIARRIRDFTVPSGRPSSRAMVLCGFRQEKRAR